MFFPAQAGVNAGWCCSIDFISVRSGATEVETPLPSRGLIIHTRSSLLARTTLPKPPIT